MDPAIVAKPAPTPVRFPYRFPVVQPVPARTIAPQEMSQTDAATERCVEPKTPLGQMMPPQSVRVEKVQEATSKTLFSRLATDSSDDIIDFDDEAVRMISPGSALGKRSSPIQSPSGAPELPESKTDPKPPKRVVRSSVPLPLHNFTKHGEQRAGTRAGRIEAQDSNASAQVKMFSYG